MSREGSTGDHLLISFAVLSLATFQLHTNAAGYIDAWCIPSALESTERERELFSSDSKISTNVPRMEEGSSRVLLVDVRCSESNHGGPETGCLNAASGLSYMYRKQRRLFAIL